MPKTKSITLRLLKMIKRFPELYNSQHDLANDKAHSAVVWDKISTELDTPASVLMRKWQRLRSSHGKRCRNLTTGKSSAPMPRDDIFRLMYSMLDPAIGDSPDDGDGSFVYSVTPTLSIVSEEGGSTGSSSTSTIVPENHTANSVHMDSLGDKNSSKLLTNRRQSTSTRVLRSQNRATRSEGSELSTMNQDHVNKRQWRDQAPENISIFSKNYENHENHFFSSAGSRCDEPIRTFFESVALTVEKFPRHIQATVKTKICNAVLEAELGLTPPVIR